MTPFETCIPTMTYQGRWFYPFRRQLRMAATQWRRYTRTYLNSLKYILLGCFNNLISYLRGQHCDNAIFSSLTVSGIIPFFILVYLNFSVFSVIRRRRHLEPSFINEQSIALKVEAAKQAYVLFAICSMFFVGHITRVALNFHELLELDNYVNAIPEDCLMVDVWTLMWASVSNLLLTVNSSVNIAIYCLMSSDFRWVIED